MTRSTEQLNMYKNTAKLTAQNFVASSGIAVVAILLSSLLRIIVMGVLSRILVPEAYGHYIIGYGLIIILSGTAQWGMPNAMLRWGAVEFYEQRFQSLKAFMYFGLFITLAAMMTLGAISFVFVEQIIGLLGNSITIYEFKLFLISGPLIVTVEIFAAIARSSKSIGWYFLLKEIIPSTVLLLLILMAFYMKMTTETVVICFILSYLITFFVGWGYLKRHFFKDVQAKWLATKYSKKSIFIFGISIALIGFLSLTKDRAIIFLVATYNDAAAAGIFFNATRLAMLMTIILSGINAVLAPQIAILYENGSIHEIQILYQRIVKWIIFLITPVVIISVLEADLVMWIVFGSEYGLAGQVFIIFALFRFFNLICGPTGIVIQMTGIERLDVYANALSLALVTISLIIVLPKYGLYWGAVASGVVGLLIDMLRVWFIKIKIGIIPINLKRVVTLCGLIIIVFAASIVISKFKISEGIHFFITLSLASLTVIISWKTLLNNEDRFLLIQLIKNIKKSSLGK